MAEVYKNFINGEWMESSSGKTFENRNPADTDDLIGIFHEASPEDVKEAIRAAREALPKWKSIPAPKRGEIIKEATEMIVKRKEELARKLTREMGKHIKEGRGDVQEAIDTGFYAFGESRRLFGKTIPSELPDKAGFYIRVPVGVVCAITPWNFPWAIPSWKIFPALVSGNTVVFKPSVYTPLSAWEFVNILNEAGVPKGVVNLVMGSGSAVGKVLVQSDGIDLYTFTGSTYIGNYIASEVSKKAKNVSLEMGGKNPIIVMPDADLELAVEGIIWGAYGTAGQRCTATSRLIVHEKIKDKLMKMLVDRVEKLKVGDSLKDESVDVGPVINQEQLEKIDQYVHIGKEEDGAELVVGGKRLTDGELAKGYFYAPTIFDHVKPEMRIAKEEIFGPVLSVITVSDFDEAIKVANNVEYGLSSSIYTKDLRLAFKMIELVESGIVYVNAPTIGAECHYPFGGVKGTGNGHREGGDAVYDIFTEIKTVYIDYSGALQKAQGID